MKKRITKSEAVTLSLLRTIFTILEEGGDPLTEEEKDYLQDFVLKPEEDLGHIDEERMMRVTALLEMLGPIVAILLDESSKVASEFDVWGDPDINMSGKGGGMEVVLITDDDLRGELFNRLSKRGVYLDGNASTSEVVRVFMSSFSSEEEAKKEMMEAMESLRRGGAGAATGSSGVN